MPPLSTAQVLPAHIIERIALFVLAPSYARSSGGRLPQLPRPEAIVQLTRVCRDWYQAIVPLCYWAAWLELDEDDESEDEDEDEDEDDESWEGKTGLTLQEIVERGHQQSVRQLVVPIQLFDSDQLQVFASLLDDCDRLPRACRVLFGIFPELQLAEDDIDVEDTARLADRIKDSFAALVDAIARTMPGIRSVGIGSYRHDWTNDQHMSEAWRIEQSLTEQLVERAYGLVGAQTAELCLAGRVALNAVPVSLPADSLRRVVITETYWPRNAIELVRRNSGSVESLHIDSSHADDSLNDYAGSDGASRMLFEDRAPGEAIEYPRLKSLHLNESLLVHARPMRLQANPLPSIEVLHVRPCWSFPIDIVLRGSRARLRSLHIDLCSWDAGRLLNSSVLADGGFPNLESVTAEGYARRSGSQSDSVLSWVFRMLARCPRLRTVRIQGAMFSLQQKMCDSIRLPPSVQSLDLSCFSVTVDQAMAIFGACPQLQVAKIWLDAYRPSVGHGGKAKRKGKAEQKPKAEREDLTAAAVSERRARYAGHAPNIRHLVLYQVLVTGNPWAGDLVLMLASLLPSVARVELPREMLEQTRGQPEQAAAGFLEHLQQARERPPFSDVAHLRDIDFCLAPRSW